MCREFDFHLWHLSKILYKNFYFTKNLIEIGDYFFFNLKSSFFKFNTLVVTIKLIKFKLKGKTLKYKRLTDFFILFKLGVTHPTMSFLQYSIYLRKKNKQRFNIFNYSYKILKINAKAFTNLKPYNIYHWRGVNVIRNLKYRKKGIVSTYMK